jgi:hypothetical protein
VATHYARIDNDKIGVFNAGRGFHATLLEDGRQPLRFGLVHLATDRPDMVMP